MIVQGEVISTTKAGNFTFHTITALGLPVATIHNKHLFNEEELAELTKLGRNWADET